MPKLPRCSAKDVLKALRAEGFEVDRQRGSHIQLRKPGEPPTHVTVPNHKELHPKTLKAILRQANLTVERFIELTRS